MKESFKLINISNDISELYGTWDILVAKSCDDNFLGYIQAHDGDFYPESIMDYVEAIRNRYSCNKGNNAIFTYPLRIDIDINQTCNANCVFCFSRVYQTEGYRGQLVNKNDLESLIAELASMGVKTIRFCGGGEPLLHPEIKDILQLPHKYGVQACLISNLDILNDDLANSIYNHVDHLRWSVNASSDKTRIKIHRPDKNSNLLSTTCNYIKEIIKQRRKERDGHKKPMIWSTFLIHPDNYEEIVEAAHLLKSIGVDSLSYRLIYFSSARLWSPRQLKEVSKQLLFVHKLHDPPNFSIFVPKRSVANSYNMNPNRFFLKCHSIYQRAIVEATSAGLMLRTCGMFRATEVRSNLIYGEKNNFRNSWLNNMNFITTRQPPKCCDKCIDISMNVTLGFIHDILQSNPETKFYRAKIYSGQS
jgi:wyosine [tRNA(Phe)-imidazoG37] synthetase (radical SAM superfamily)